MMKKTLLMLLLLASLPAIAQTDDMQRLFSYFKAAAGFDHRYPREKVYLHLDNNAYFEDETLWFKAYVVRASSLQPTTLSRVLYVELLKDDGQLIERKLLRLDSLGQAHGDFKLELPIKSGFHEIRAYTREMVNWGEEACFSRVFPVFEKPHARKKDLRLEDISSEALNITLPDDNVRNAKLPKQQRRFGRDNDISLEFYPEGGNRAEGVMQRIAYVVSDGHGARLSETVNVYRADGSLLTTSETEHEGMGSFNLPADMGNGGYAEVRGKRFDLPPVEPQQAYALQTSLEEDGITVYVSPAPSARPELLGLAIHCRDLMCYLDTLTVSGEPVGLYIPNTALHGGVNRIDLYNTRGESLCRRLVWKPAPERGVELKVRQSQRNYEAFSPVALEMELKDAAGQPISTTFSLSVRDEGGELVRANAASAYADMLLSSELKGYIHQPDFYFEKNDAQHRRALDLLLMVQGWSANTFETLCGHTPFTLQQPIEESLTLNGYAYKDNNKREPYPNLDLKVKMYSRAGGSLEAETVTDSLGRFAFVSNVDYAGNWIAQFNTTNAEGKKKWSRIALDRWFSPAVRPLYFQETQLEIPMPRIYETDADSTQDFFAWTDTIPKSISTNLKEAVVSVKGKYRGFTGNRYTYNGGEKAGMRNGDEFYNVETAVERYKDMGYMPGTILSFLGVLSNDFSTNFKEEGVYTPLEGEDNLTNTTDVYSPDFVSINGSAADPTETTAQATYHGSPIPTYLNNAQGYINQNEIGQLMAEEVKSVAVVKGAARIGRITTFDENNNFSQLASTGDRALFIYELPDAYLYRTKKGVEKRRIWGYAQPTKFYHPSYRGIDMPTSKDVRRTLYWNPEVKTDAEGKASAVFFTNCRDEVQIRISARGITPDGRMVDAEK